MAWILTNLLVVLVIISSWQTTHAQQPTPEDMLGVTRGSLEEVTRDSNTVNGNTIIKYQHMHCEVKVQGSQGTLELLPTGDWGEVLDNQIVSRNLLPRNCPDENRPSKDELIRKILSDEGDIGDQVEVVYDVRYDAELCWILDKEQNRMRLICKFSYVVFHVKDQSDDANTQVGDDPIRKVFHMDAITGEIILREVGLATFAYLMDGLGGNIIFGKHQYGNWEWAGRKLLVDFLTVTQCRAQNTYARVHNGGGTFSCGTFPFDQVCNNFLPLNTHSFHQVNDVLYFTTDFLEMLKDCYADLSLPNYCGQIYACANYGIYDNAFYTGCRTYYGLGSTYFYGLGSPDVVAHELCHGLTAAVSGLYYWGESGGINEAFSDICGETYEAFLHHGRNDWKLGYGIMKTPFNSGKDALRYMAWPPKDDRSIQCQADYVQGLDVHYSSGLYNKVFYLLANKQGWCIKRAFEVFLRANKYIWSPTTTFNRGACGVIWAASTYGYSVQDVEDAFAAVGIFCRCPPGFIMRNNWSCYKFARDLASWAEAKVTCEALGATLAVVDDAAEFSWIQQQLLVTSVWTKPPHHDLNQFSAYWVGGSDQGIEGQWRWLSVSPSFPISYLPWAFSQPDNLNTFQNCLALSSYYYNIYFRYFDEDCQDRKYFLCERTCQHYHMDT